MLAQTTPSNSTALSSMMELRRQHLHAALSSADYMDDALIQMEIASLDRHIERSCNMLKNGAIDGKESTSVETAASPASNDIVAGMTAIAIADNHADDVSAVNAVYYRAFELVVSPKIDKYIANDVQVAMNTAAANGASHWRVRVPPGWGMSKAIDKMLGQALAKRLPGVIVAATKVDQHGGVYYVMHGTQDH
jgi:hypothetical protein